MTSSLLDTVILRWLLLWITACLLPAHYALNNDTVGSHDALHPGDCCIEIQCLVIHWQCSYVMSSMFEDIFIQVSNEALSQKTLEFEGNLTFWDSEGWTKPVLPRFKLLNTSKKYPTYILKVWVKNTSQKYETYDLYRVIEVILYLSN